MAPKIAQFRSKMRINTEKGWLEPLHPSHAEALFELIHNSRRLLHPWLPWLKRIHSTQDTQAFIERLIEERGPQFVIRVDNQICGGVGFYIINQDTHEATIGYWLGEGYTGLGIMRDAIRAICLHGFRELNLHQLQIRCAAENHQSRKVPENLGFIYEGKQIKAEWLGDKYVDHAIYSLDCSEAHLLSDEALCSSQNTQ